MSHEKSLKTNLKSTLEYRVRGIAIKLHKDSKVYSPSVATLLIAENLRNVEGAEVLDLGTGSGFLAILAAKLEAKKVVATDISSRALRVARKNASLNNVEKKIEFRFGNLYQPVEDECFDLIICNPPMTPSRMPVPRFTWGGRDGRAVLDKVIEGAPRHLKKNGRLIVSVVSLVGIGESVKLMEKMGLRPEVLDYCIYPFGKTLIRLIDHLKTLPNADYVFDGSGRPCWRLVVFEAIKS
ncbi:MAG TPA: methyltransferase domain-containing protein [Nitrososphaeria archaeon]|nr:methyltransferase domain-containing protein [Nitrososphaeria archaeon]